MLATKSPAHASGTTVPLEMRTQQNQYLRGIDNAEISRAVNDRPDPKIRASRHLTPERRAGRLLHRPHGVRAQLTCASWRPATDRYACRRSTVPDPQR